MIDYYYINLIIIFWNYTKYRIFGVSHVDVMSKRASQEMLLIIDTNDGQLSMRMDENNK